MSNEEKEKWRQQEELRQRVIKEQLSKDPIIQYTEELNSYLVRNELEFTEQRGEPEEWTNIPFLVARFLIIN